VREIVLDTETTGLDPDEGDRIVEIGCVELEQHVPTGKTRCWYINPQRKMPTAAFDVHGLSDEFLRDKKIFAQVVDDFLEFIGDATLVIHNASFDIKFLNAELTREQRPVLRNDVEDTLELARRRFPGSPASLDALCRRFRIDNGVREKHSALIDSKLLAEVYLELRGGRQPDFRLNTQTRAKATTETSGSWCVYPRRVPLKPRLTKEERIDHAKFVEELGPDTLWPRSS